MAQTIRIKSSTVAGRTPTGAQLERAELCINLADRKLFSKDQNDEVFEVTGGASVPGGDTPPATDNQPGDLFFDTTTNTLLYWDGSNWLPIAGEDAISLEGLSDVTIGGLADGDVLSWDDINSQWVNRPQNSLPYVPAGPDGNWDNLPAVTALAADDLMLINTGGVSSQITGTNLSASLGGGGALTPIEPIPGQISATPAFVSGSGTEADPFILSEGNAFPAGGTTNSAQVITIDMGEGANGTVRWTDNSAAASGTRFRQATDQLDVNGTWSGRLAYHDNPDSTAETAYTGDLQIGTCFFRWIVEQEITANINPTPDEVTANPAFQGGEGTQGNPYRLQLRNVAPAGGSTTSVEQITISIPGGAGGRPVQWTDNSQTAGVRFQQPTGVTAEGGVWTGRLEYNDTPNSVADVDYTGDLQIGSTYFRWVVEQRVTTAVDPTPADMTFNPAAVGGTGTVDDPYQLTPTTVAPAGATGTSVQEITITVPNIGGGRVVNWTDNSTAAGNRFAQPPGVTTDDNGNGVWTGRLQYVDVPLSAGDSTYTGDLQIGTAFVRWVVDQNTAVVVDPTPDQVTGTPAFQSGSGTEVDPYVLETVLSAPAGSTVTTSEEITITVPATPNANVVWNIVSVTNSGGARFDQPIEQTDGSGIWTGRLTYTDAPNTTVDTNYQATIQIGTTFFTWTVQQYVLNQIRPTPNDITSNPGFESGAGTPGDPFILRTIDVRPAGNAGQSEETLTITAPSGLADIPVVWQVNSVTAGGGARFDQADGVTGAGGVWTGRLTYDDTPSSAGDVTYEAVLQIGTIYIQWSVNQFLVNTIAPVLDSVSLVESNPDEDPRFTSQQFVASTSLSQDGVPSSDKIFTAYVEGAITVTPTSSQITNVEEVNESGTYVKRLTLANDQDLTVFEVGDAVQTDQTSQFDAPLESTGTGTGRTYSSDLTARGGFQSGNPATAAFNGSESDWARANNGPYGLVWDTSAYPLNGELEVYASCGSIIATLANGSTQTLATGDTFFQTLNCGTVSNVTSVEFQNNGDANPAGVGLIRLEGAVFIDGASVTNLVFADGTDMDALAAGDTVNQTREFTAPLESSGSVTGPTYSNRFGTWTPTVGGGVNSISNPNACFDGVTNTYGLAAQNVQPTGTSTIPITFDPPIKTTENIVFLFGNNLVNYPVYGVTFFKAGDAGNNQFRDLKGPIQLDGLGNFITTIDFTQSNWPSDFTECDRMEIFLQTNSVFQPQLWGTLTLNGKVLIDDESLTTITFASDTDMAALAPGDAVSQAASIAARTWSNDLSSNNGTYGSAANAFNGELTGGLGGDVGAYLTWDTSAYPLTTTNIQVQCFANNVIVNYQDGTQDNITANPNVPSNDLNGQLQNKPITSIAVTNNTSGPYIYAFTVDGEVVIDGQGINQPTGTVGSINSVVVTLSTSNGTWENGEDVTNGGVTTSGEVVSITGTTVTLNDSSTWTNGLNVNGPNALGTGEIHSINTGTPSMSLVNCVHRFANGMTVTGPQKTPASVRRYLDFRPNGTVLDLVAAPVQQTYNTANPGVTFTFPATFPDGVAPDDDLPEGTTMNVEVTATNTAGTSGPLSAQVQPEGTNPLLAALNGLTRAYPGNGAGQTLVTGIDMTTNAGLVWIKSRTSNYTHRLLDTLRGAQENLVTTNGDASYNDPSTLQAFINNGFTLGSSLNVNGNSTNYVAWSFLQLEDYFDVVEWDGINSNQTINHSLSTKPGFIITKCITNNSAWYCYHSGLQSADRNYLSLNTNAAAAGDQSQSIWEATESTFQAASYLALTNSGDKYIAYLFAEDTPNVIKCGTYEGNNTTNNVVTGFDTQWVLIRNSSTGGNWGIYDHTRGANAVLNPNSNNAENNIPCTLSATGFTVTGGATDVNTLGDQYVYVAIAAPTTRSMTEAEFAETDLKLTSYDYRKAAYALDVERQRQALIDELTRKGYTPEQVTQAIGD